MILRDKCWLTLPGPVSRRYLQKPFQWIHHKSFSLCNKRSSKDFLSTTPTSLGSIKMRATRWPAKPKAPAMIPCQSKSSVDHWHLQQTEEMAWTVAHRRETEMHLPSKVFPHSRYCLMKMHISQTASQTSSSHDEGCHSAYRIGKGYAPYLLTGKTCVQMCWMSWVAPFHTICHQSR